MQQATNYAQAFDLATRDKSEEEVASITSRLITLLKERGHIALYPSVVRAYERQSRRRTSSDTVLIRVAKPNDVQKFASSIAEDLRSVEAGQVAPQTVVDETAIGGYEVRAHGLRLDRTYKQRLLTLYDTLKRTS